MHMHADAHTNPDNAQNLRAYKDAYTHLLSRIVACTVLDGIVYCAYVVRMFVRVCFLRCV
jgi:hypothetical protein